MKLFALRDDLLKGFHSHILECESVTEAVAGVRDIAIKDQSGFYRKTLPGSKLVELGDYNRETGTITPTNVVVYDFASLDFGGDQV